MFMLVIKREVWTSLVRKKLIRTMACGSYNKGYSTLFIERHLLTNNDAWR